MKIIHIIDSAGLYGAEIMLLNLAREQSRLGHKPVIASIREKNEQDLSLEDEAKRRGLNAVTFRMVDGPNFIGAWEILSYAKQHQANILHSHGFKGDIILGFIPRVVRKIPLLTTLHGWTNTQRFSKLRVYEYIDSLSLKFMDAVCLVNENMIGHEYLKNLKDRIHVIPNGIPPLNNLEYIPEGDISEFCRQGFTVISIGRLSKEKGYSYLIDAFDLFQKNAQNVRLLIIGEGPERRNLESMVIERGLSENVMLPGYCYNAWQYLEKCRVFVLSSLTEGLPITLLEAMQIGIPVVATDVGGIPMVIRQSITGTLIPPEDPVLLSNALLKIYQSYQSAYKMALNGKDLITKKYSSLRMTQDYLGIYNEILSRNTSISS